MSEPASRRASSEYLPSTHGPIPLFDTQLKFLNDSYLSLFLERKRIEEIYVDSLLKLHRKVKSIDSFLDDRGDLSTARSAWGEVRENLERESQARQAFLATLNADVIHPLTALKETQERTRKRIKEDLKESGLAYHEYAEVTLPRLKNRYLKKYQEVEESKRAAASPSMPIQQPTPGPDYHGLGPRSHPTSSRPQVTSPQPLRALDRRPSGSAPSGRNRSPSSSTAFSDFAKEGKKQLNQLIGLLDKGGSVKDTLGGGRENHALRTVRTKRELDEADKEYRRGVYWLETLRLKRIKTLESGYNSLVMFVEECAEIVKKVLEKYTDNMTATNATQTQLASHARGVVSKISPEKDKAKFAAFIPKSLASAIPEPILYQNCIVGECHDLIFGFSLLDYATTKNLPDGEVPKIVRLCVAEIDKRGLEAEGIYRVSGRHAIVQVMQHELEKDEEVFEFTPRDDIYAVASLLKVSAFTIVPRNVSKFPILPQLYLRELPEPVFRFSLQERIQHSEDFAEHQSNNFILLRSKMRRLPPVHQATLKALVEHLARVASHSEKNKMDPKNLAIVFGGVIFGEDEIPKGVDLLSVQSFKDSLMEDLIMNAHILFNDDPHANHSPPLPPMPSDEPAPLYYGSKTTKIASVPPSPIIVPPMSLSDDFSPALPPRPMHSIHPSARSPTKERSDITPPLPLRPSQRQKREDILPPPPSPSATASSVSVFETDDSTSYEGGRNPDEESGLSGPTLSSPPSSPHKGGETDSIGSRSLQRNSIPPSPRIGDR
uniref:Rho-GAP domain-containing protein n=1 Tax=Moniliophthora roreri TaxID=221103 RepID=A0A0W0FAQ9_MONRR